MRLFCKLGLFVLCATSAFAQFGAQSNALGGSFASRGMGHPLGGVAPSAGLNRNTRGFRRGPATVLPYAYSFYVPNYFDDLDTYPPAPAYAPPYYAPAPGPVPVVQSAPPVIINQYFGGPPPVDRGSANAQGQPDSSGASSAQAPGAPLGPTDKYYLIAYKNHSIYTALAYWIEGDTLHYVTTENTHNQASLALIDLDLTKKLNQDRSVPFSLPGQ